MIAKTPPPPYYAVIFTSVRTDVFNGYSEMSSHMIELAGKQEGFLGFESARNDVGITVSYWKDLKSIARWKQHVLHQAAQRRGQVEWYRQYKVRISKVEKEYGFERTESQSEYNRSMSVPRVEKDINDIPA
jgi:Uncharacterized enzyme involved in biosynthesis of extracellular polysaccharides